MAVLTMKVLVFDAWGDYAHYRKIYTTTSPLTYSIPTKTSLAGLIGAIIGLEKDSYHDLFNQRGFKVAVRLLNPVEKTTMNINLTDTKYPNAIRDGRRTQIPFEFLRNPRYRIYVSIEDSDTYHRLKQALSSEHTHFTPCLGLSECIASIKFVGEYAAKPKKVKAETHIVAAVDTRKNNILFQPKKHYCREKMPLQMDGSRQVLEFGDIAFETHGGGMRITSGEYFEVGDEHVSFI